MHMQKEHRENLILTFGAIRAPDHPDDGGNHIDPLGYNSALFNGVTLDEVTPVGHHVGQIAGGVVTAQVHTGPDARRQPPVQKIAGTEAPSEVGVFVCEPVCAYG